MKKIYPYLCYLAILMMGWHPAAQPQNTWWEINPWIEPDRGFNWYPDDLPSKKPKVAEPQPTTVEQVHQKWKRLRNQAIMEPTVDNIQAYLAINKWVLQQAQTFADNWRKVVWQHPELDYNTEHPFALFAQPAVKDQFNHQRQRLVDYLRRPNTGLIFFFRGTCEFCHLQARILAQMKNHYHLSILAISLDGGKLTEFPDAKLDNGISAVVSQGSGISTVPSLFWIDKHQKVFLGAGLMSEEEVLERLQRLTIPSP
ncbi:MAG: conjugal transfer protein TraF [Gammaproteobacteria bacterium]|nr:conjugal transfer protein TraF [Gammaproteobacteria bacterium]